MGGPAGEIETAPGIAEVAAIVGSATAMVERRANTVRAKAGPALAGKEHPAVTPQQNYDAGRYLRAARAFDR